MELTLTPQEKKLLIESLTWLIEGQVEVLKLSAEITAEQMSIHEHAELREEIDRGETYARQLRMALGRRMMSE